ncbi:MAG: hypothetical protein LBB89_13580 [Treponema sp.]|nr:hypothetical protein [Treponema sp.]
MVILTTLFFISQPLWAQDAQSAAQGAGHYVIEQRYVQQLVWVGDEYTFKYEVVIERGEGKTYSAYQREFTEKPALQISLPPGNYRYRIISYDYLEQPGGVSEWVNLEIKPSPTVSVDEQTESGSDIFNFYLSAAWSPLIPVYGGIQEIFGKEFYAAGASLRFGAFFNKLNWWFIPGLELSTSWYTLNKAQGGDTVGIYAGVTGFNIAMQKNLPNPKMTVTLRTGGALAFQTGETNSGEESYTIGGIAPQFNVEASFLYQVWKQLYIEAGAGFTFHLSQNNSSGYLRPWLGAGWKF